MPPSATNPIAGSSSGTNQNENTSRPLGRSRMPKPGEKNAPQFDVDKPEELGRFFERVEDWFIDDNIEDDEEKKRRIVRYLDPDSEIQWKALSTFIDGTYAEFKDQVMKSYPAAEDVMKGSVSALKRKIKKIGLIELDDRDELLSLVRTMTAEVMKLKKISPPIHTNRELVELFLSRLSTEFAHRVAGKLSMRRLVGAGKDKDAEGTRNPEDMYDIEEVMEMAKHTSLEQANPFGKFLVGTPTTRGDTSVKLEETVARLADSVDLQVKYNKQVEQKLNNLQSFMNQPRYPQQSSYDSRGPSSYNRGNTYTSNTAAQPQINGCFYCFGNHRMSECEHVARHMDMGLIKRVDGHLRLGDGSRLVRDPTRPLKDQVESQSSTKPGIIPMNKIGDKSSLFHNVPRASNFVQHQLPIDEQDALKNVLELVQRVGLNQAQRLLAVQDTSAQLQTFEEDIEDWDQNFDVVQ
jgi:hypothetical protein